MGHSLLVFPIFVILLLFQTAFPGITGKIVGTVLDQASGEPLPGVNLVLLNSYFGASSDYDGNFLILNIPPGEYDLEVTMLGYQKLTKKNIKVSVDLTTSMEIRLTET